jgi:hippurate hydrolase
MRPASAGRRQSLTQPESLERCVDVAKHVVAGSAELLTDIDELYRWLHSHPELSGQEEATSRMVAERLASAGCRVEGGVGGHGVVGVLENGPGPVVALRADMDGLPIREETGLDYESTAVSKRPDGSETPVMHACGHDVHMAAMIGSVNLLAARRDLWSGTLVAIGQPAEETVSGADAMIADGLFRRFPVPSVVLGQHTYPVASGTILHRAGQVYAANANLRVRLFGSGTHGARPERGIDPITMAAYAVTRLQTIVSREVPPRLPAVVTVGSIHAGTKANIIPDAAELELTVRALDPSAVDTMIASISRIFNAEANASGAKQSPEILVEERTAALVNDEQVVNLIRHVHEKLFGDDVWDLPEPNMTSEDFAEYGAADVAGDGVGPIPLGFWFLGVTPRDIWDQAGGSSLVERMRNVPGTHTSRFAPDRTSALSRGVESMAAAAIAHLVE